MLVKLLGFIDVGVAILLVLAQYGMPINRFYILFVLAHAIKAGYFFRNFLSIVDLVIAAYTIVLPFWNDPIITMFVALFLLYKGIWSQF